MPVTLCKYVVAKLGIMIQIPSMLIIIIIIQFVYKLTKTMVYLIMFEMSVLCHTPFIKS